MRFEKLSKLVSEISELQARVREAAQEEFKPALREVVHVLRDEVPNVTHLQWQQWIPNFNDGDPCEFMMGRIRVRFSDKELGSSGDYSDGFIESNYNEKRAKAQGENIASQQHLYDLTELVVQGYITHEQAVLLSGLADQIAHLEGAAEIAFGPDTQITLEVATGQIEIEDYDCGF
jgi:hypothetical protein